MFDFDSSFIEELVSGNKMAFNSFYVKTVDIFFRYAKSHSSLSSKEIEDVLSDFYIKLRRVLDRYSPEKWHFQWFVRTTFKNTFKDSFKKRYDYSFADFRYEESSLEDDLMSDDDVVSFLNTNFQYDQIITWLDLLDEASREIVVFHFIEWLSTKEISELLGVSRDVVRKRLSRALAKLRKLLN